MSFGIEINTVITNHFNDQKGEIFLGILFILCNITLSQRIYHPIMIKDQRDG